MVLGDISVMHRHAHTHTYAHKDVHSPFCALLDPFISDLEMCMQTVFKAVLSQFCHLKSYRFMSEEMVF